MAVSLAKFLDIQVDIYEAAQDFKEVGAGVMIWGRTWRVLTLLGMDKTLRDVAGVALDGSEGTISVNWSLVCALSPNSVTCRSSVWF